jgi:hypothetical protein
MNVLRTIGAGAFLALCAAVSYGQDSSAIKITPHGSANMDVGSVVKGFDKNAGDISMVEYNRIFLQTGLNVRLSEKTKFTGTMGVESFNEFPRLVKLGATRRFYYYLYLHQAELVHTVIDNSAMRFDIGGGYFPYKYNDDARNLGEYLFRSTAYPQTLTTEFDMPWARLLGLYGRYALPVGKNKLKVDLLLTSNTEWVAIGDVNLTLISAFNIARIFEIGAGVELGSIISADENTTTPINDATRYMNGTDTSNYYTFRGTKVMGRFSFDPKKLLSIKVLGDQDLKLYGEAAILGVKSYDRALHSPVWYNSFLERIPVTLGLNLPAFKLLDVLSLEGEWWGNRYPNSMQGIVNDGIPLPFPAGTTQIDSTPYKNDNLKWSVYCSKSFAERYRVSFQAASDHMRTFAWDWNRQDWEEALRGTDKWYFVLRFGVFF